MGNFSFQVAPIYILLCILLGLLYAFTLYFRDRKFLEHKNWLPLVLGMLRFGSVAMLSFLLLVPMLKSIFEEIKNPIIIIASDESSSVQNLANATEVSTKLDAIGADLSSDFQVDRYYFSHKMESDQTDSTDRKSTNLEDALTTIDELYINQNVGAVILATDGIYNEGKNPLYLNTNITSPIYTVALGDTTEKKDLILKRTLNNDIVFLGDRFVVQVDIEAVSAAGQSTNLRISKVDDQGQRTTLQNKTIRIDKNDFFTTEEVILEANESGVIRYVASLSPVDGELTRTNNQKDIFIEVLDARQQILLLANAPHPDISAIKQIVESNKNYEIDIQLVDVAQIRNQPYDLVILHNLPSPGSNLDALLTLPSVKDAARFYILGSQTDQSKFNASQSVFSINGNSNSLNEVQAILEDDFKFFTISDALRREIGNYPPIITPFGNYTISPNATILLNQKIGKVDTEYPLLAFNDQGGIKTAVLAGEGIWKWRLFNFLQKNHYDEITELLNKSFQYLTLKEDKRRFRVSPTQNIFRENENIIITAELYNDSYEKINDPEVSISIFDGRNNSFEFSFSRKADFYYLDASQFPSGNYRYTATTTSEGKREEASGRFSVESIQLESFDLTARHGLLRSLSEKYGGKLISSSQMDQLGTEIRNNNQIKPVIYASSRTNKWMDNKWVFYLIFGLLGIEWFLRRYFGSY